MYGNYIDQNALTKFEGGRYPKYFGELHFNDAISSQIVAKYTNMNAALLHMHFMLQCLNP